MLGGFTGALAISVSFSPLAMMSFTSFFFLSILSMTLECLSMISSVCDTEPACLLCSRESRTTVTVTVTVTESQSWARS